MTTTLTPTQRWIRRGYQSERRMGKSPIEAAAEVRNSYARMVADQLTEHGRATDYMLDSYRCAKQWLALVMAREAQQRPDDIGRLISSLRASCVGPAIVQVS